MNRRRYDNSERFDRTSKDDYRGGRYQNSSRYEDSRNSYKSSSHRNEDNYRNNDRYRNDDSRNRSSFVSSHRRNDVRPKTPPPPSFRSSGNSYTRGSNRNYDNRHARNNYSPPRRRQNEDFNGSRGGPQRYNPRFRAPVRRDNDRPRIIKRKIIMSTTRKFNSLRDRTRMIRLAKLKRTRDSLKSKTSKKAKGSDSEEDEDNKNGENEKSEDEKSVKKENDADDDDKEKKKDDDENKEDKEKTSKDDEKPKRRAVKRERSASTERKPKPYIKLVCVHCKTTCKTFNDYQHHLHKKTHRMAMRRVAIRQKSQISKMRLAQRNAQKELEDNSKDDLGDQQYCLICRLNYKTGKAKHQVSEHHKKMKKFLMPYCGTCHIAFKSPTVYQTHRSSLDHIKRKARDNQPDSDNSDDEMAVDLKEFTTVDSIGDIDDDVSADEIDTADLDDESMGIKFVNKVEALYCETCEDYLSHDLTNEDEIISKHCKTRRHLRLVRKAAVKDEEMAVDETEVNEDVKVEEEEHEEDEDVKNGTMEDEETEPAEKSTADDNDDGDENDETILDINISSEKNSNDNDEAEEED